jgi:hypothetical protein
MLFSAGASLVPLFVVTRDNRDADPFSVETLINEPDEKV